MIINHGGHALRMTIGITVLAILLMSGSADAAAFMANDSTSTVDANQWNIFSGSDRLGDNYIASRTVHSYSADDKLKKGILDISQTGKYEKANSNYFFDNSYVEDKTGKSRVIIQFHEEPVLSYAVKLKAEHKKEAESKIKAHKDNIFNIHSNAKKEIEQNNIEIKYTQEYYEIFNGFAAEISSKDIVKLKKLSTIKAVYPDQKVYASLTDSVPLINANSVWNMLDANGTNITGKNVKVAIIDTGIDYTHPDLGGGFGSSYKVIAGWDFFNNDPDPMDDHGHGTHVAGIVAANGTLKGVAPDAQLMAYKVLSSGGWGYESHIIAGIENAVDPDGNPSTDDGADVISMSLGGWGNPDDPMSQAVDNAVDNGVVAVVAAGNSGSWSETISSPGTARKAITVGATDKQDIIAGFSSRGPVVWNGGMIVKPDVVAPGVSIYSTVPAGSCALCSPSKYNTLSGTSMATPMVAGTAVLLIQKNRDWSPVEVKMALRGTAKNLNYDINTQGYGRIEAFKAASLESAPPVAILNTSGIVNGTINIAGTATGREFANYTVEYGNGNGTWLNIGNSTASVIDNVLIYGWDTSPVSDGNYFLRLTVRGGNGSSEDQTMININNVELYYPLNNDIFRLGDVIEINGTIRGAIENYTFEYGRGYEPASWLNQGINITYQGSHDTVSGVLAAWNTSFITEAGFYTLRITVHRNTSVSTEYVRNIYLDPTLKKGWPVKLDWESSPCPWNSNEICYFGGGFLEPTIKDIDNDGVSEIIVYSGGIPPKIYVFKPDGSLKPGWPVNVGSGWAGGGNLPIPVVADIDNDGLSEIIAFNFNSNYLESSELYAFKPDGSLMNGRPVLVPRDYHPTIIAADLNNDGRKEIVVNGNGGFNRYLTIVNAYGTVASQWRLNNVSWGGSIVSSPAIGNFDNDPDLEIVSASPAEGAGGIWENGTFKGWNNTGVIHVFNIDGSEVHGWPVYTDGIPFSSPAVGDINQDGSPEIVVGLLYASDIFPDYRYGGLYAFYKNGTVMPGWPFMKGYNFWSSPSLADFNGDGTLEIAASRLGFETYVLYHTATLLPGWPQQTVWNDYYSTVTGDINSDGVPEIITTSGNGIPPYNGGVYAWNVNGTLLSGFPRVTEVDAQGPAAIGDIDNDGRADLLASSNYDFDFQTNKYKLRGTVYAWETSGSYDSQKMPWQTFHHDNSRTGLYNYTDTIAPPITPPASITNLRNVSYAQDYINWTWNDPADADFDHVQVYIDGSHENNVPKGVQFYNATGFVPDSEHTIATRTVNISGNISQAWVNHTARTSPVPDITPPASVTNLQNTSYTQSYINWTWNDPEDADFSHVMVYLDGIFRTIVPKGIQYHVATGLKPDTPYTIGLRAVDASWNINETWVNHTARTAPITIIPPVTELPVDRIENRGTVASGLYSWDAHNFPGLYYDLKDDLTGEILSVSSLGGRTIPVDGLVYETHTMQKGYQVYINKGILVNGRWFYSIVGWQGRKYVALNDKANKLTELLIEQGAPTSEKKTLVVNETWDLGEGWSLTLVSVNVSSSPRLARLELNKDGTVLDDKVVADREAYVYSANLSDEFNVPLFVTYVDSVFAGATTNMTQFRYTWLMSDNVTIITAGDKFGKLTVQDASSLKITLKNDAEVTLPKDSIVNIMGALDFRTADNDTLRYYPFVEHTEPGTYELRGSAAYGAQSWDAYNFSALYYDLNYDAKTETLNVSSIIFGRTIPVDGLVYETHTIPRDYQVYINKGALVNGRGNYSIVGWQGQMRVALNGSANKLTKLLLEHGNLASEKKTLVVNDTWDLGEGWNLKVLSVNTSTSPRKALLELSKNGTILDDRVVAQGEAYVYSANISGESNAPLFVTYVDSIFAGATANMVQFRYTWLISDNVTVINAGEIYGSLTVRDASVLELVLKNDDEVTLPRYMVVNVMNALNFRTADSDVLRYYPFMKMVISGLAPASVTNLRNISYAQNYINWTWTDPSDADFDYVEVYIDGSFENNVPKGVQFYYASRFVPDSEHTIATRTVDISGNINQTWVNHTARTAPGTTIPPVTELPVNRVEVRGTVASGTYAWDAYNFPALYYDLKDEIAPETLNVSSIGGRIIPVDGLAYETQKTLKGYQVYINKGILVNGRGDYDITGWQGQRYVALNGKTNKLTELLVEQGAPTSEKKTLAVNETWDLGEGWALKLLVADAKSSPRHVRLELSKNGTILDDKVVAQGEAYVYSANLSGEFNVPLFVTYVDSIFAGATSDMAQFRYTWLVSDNVTVINAGEIYGSLTVRAADALKLELKNDAEAALSKGSIVNIMGTLNFRTADNDTLRYYPFAEYTEPGTYEVRGSVAYGAQSWDAYNFSAFYYDLEDDARTELLNVSSISFFDRIIPVSGLAYETHKIPRDYQVYINKGILVNGRGNYSIIGWQGQMQVALNGKENKLTDLILEQNSTENKTFAVGETWELGEGWTVAVRSIDAKASPRQVWLILSKDGVNKDDKVVAEGAVYTYVEKSIGGESDVPLFVTYVDSVFAGENSDMAELKYTWLISDNVKVINPGNKFGILTVETIDPRLVLKNDAEVTLSRDSTINIMGALNFRVADSDALRYYPFMKMIILPGAPPAIRGVSLTNISPLNQATSAGTNATYLIELANKGTDADLYTLILDNPDSASTAALSISSPVLLNAGEGRIFSLNVTNTSAGTFRVNVTARSNNDTTMFGYINTTTSVIDITPPGSVTNLRNISFAQNYINWTWTDPEDSDFSDVSVLIDGIFDAGVSKSVQYYNASGFAPDSEHTIATRTVDTNGNINQTWINHTARTAPLPDTTPPTTTIALSGSPGNNSWYISDVQVALTATDNEGGSGVNKIEYSFDLTNWNTYTVPFAITDEGITAVYYRSIDNSSNVEQTRNETVRIDKTPPIILGAATTSPNANGWYNSDVTVHFTASDTLSGVDIVTPDAAISTEGINQSVTGVATDKAGNSNTTTVSGINIDKTKPEITAERTPEPNANGWNNGSVTVSFNASDALSGIDGNSTETGTLNSEGVNLSISRTFTDKAGNANTATVSGINIDLTPPNIGGETTTSPNANGWYNSDVVVHFTASDTLSGVDIVTPDATISTEGINQSVTGVATDKAGNSNTTTVFGINIDKTKPGIIITSPVSRDYLHSESITFIFEATDALSGNDSTLAFLDGATVANGEVVELRTLTLGEHNLTINTIDKAGNGASRSVSFNVKPIPATIDFRRDVLRKSSSDGRKLFTVYIEVSGYDVNAIDVSTVILITTNGTVPALLSPTEVGDNDRDGIPDRTVNFDRQAVAAIVDVGEHVVITIRGKIAGAIFEGSGEIRVRE